MNGFGGVPAANVARMVSAAASDNATLVTTGGAAVKVISGFNAKAATVFLKLYQKTTAPASTDTPKMTIPIPAGLAFAFDYGDGIFFQGLGYRITAAAADADATNLVAADVLGLNIAYAS